MKWFRDSLEHRVAYRRLANLEEGGAYNDIRRSRGGSATLRIRRSPVMRALQALDERRAAGAFRFITERPKLLRSLAALGDWDTLLEKYQEFDRYEASFPEMQALHHEALEESARIHARRARALEQRSDFERASKEAATALLRDPSNREIRKLLGDEKLLASRGEALTNVLRAAQNSSQRGCPPTFASATRSTTTPTVPLPTRISRRLWIPFQDAEHEAQERLKSF